MELFVFDQLTHTRWGEALFALERAIYSSHNYAPAPDVLPLYRSLYRNLVESSHADLASAVADGLLYTDSALARASVRSSTIPAGLYEGAARDIITLLHLLRRNWHNEVSSIGNLLGQDVPPLAHLALASDQPHQRVSQGFADNLKNVDYDAERLLEQLIAFYRHQGYGTLARFDAFRWHHQPHAPSQQLEGVTYPALPDMSQLIGIERQLTALCNNTETFLAGKPAQHTLLYGPRGSGKSTAIKSLLTRYRNKGLRLIEVSLEHLPDLPIISERLRPQPGRFVMFVDDLSFDAGDSRYQPLKTLLEGSLSRRPDNVLVYATSNRRHLVTERLSDRPDPLDDDVHVWDTHNERLALADRFGLTLTFPSSGQREFLDIVYGLAKHANLTLDKGFEQRALQFAKWGNGLSGRVAQQFIDSERAR
jgi:hypothetical protein